MSPSASYRPDIDGLRALAVVSVLLFHAEFSLFSGGFVGVDVFFVISGFLITRLLRREITEGTFSFRKFYLRRLRRLGPAMLVTVLITAAVAPFLFGPIRLAQFGESAIYAVFSVSNFLFWDQAGYFDSGAFTKPLLHTWSLAVEEQFYLFWPALLLLLARVKRTWVMPLGLGVLGVVSLVVGQILLEDHPAAVFFLTPYRVIEFSIGALLVWTERLKTKPILADLLLAVGLGAFTFSVLSFGKHTAFPGVNALLPCLAAAVVIQWGAAPRVGILLRYPLARGIGFVSYSAYLVHWPLYCFYRGAVLRRLTETEGATIVIASLVLAVPMYRFVERPFRQKAEGAIGTTRQFLVVAACLTIGLSSLGAHMWQTRGWPGRPAFAGAPFADRDPEAELLRRRDWVTGMCKEEGLDRLGCIDPKRPNGLIVGNSHAMDGANIFRAIFGEEHNLLLSWKGSCPPLPVDEAPEILNPQMSGRSRCLAMNKQRFTKEYYEGIDYVVISALMNKKMLNVERLSSYIKFLHSVGVKNIVVVGGYITIREDMPVALQQLGSVEKVVEELSKNSFIFNDQLKRLCKKERCLFIDKKKLLCQDGQCTYQANGAPFTWDMNHLSLEFATLVGEKARTQVRRYLSRQLDQ